VGAATAQAGAARYRRSTRVAAKLRERRIKRNIVFYITAYRPGKTAALH
jgi:hypothetical protein